MRGVLASASDPVLSLPSAPGLRGGDGGLPAVLGAEEKSAHCDALQGPDLLPQGHAQGTSPRILSLSLVSA